MQWCDQIRVLGLQRFIVGLCVVLGYFFFSSRRRHTRCSRDWSSDVCSSDLELIIKKYADTDYATDSYFKLDYVNDVLASKEM